MPFDSTTIILTSSSTIAPATVSRRGQSTFDVVPNAACTSSGGAVAPNNPFSIVANSVTQSGTKMKGRLAFDQSSIATWVEKGWFDPSSPRTVFVTMSVQGGQNEQLEVALKRASGVAAKVLAAAAVATVAAVTVAYFVLGAAPGVAH